MNRSLVRPAACALAAAAFTLILLAASASSASAQTITLSGFGCSGTVAWSSASNTLTCQGSTPSGAPSGCSISGAPTSSVAAGTQVTLTINCNSGGTANAWTWTSGTAGSTQTVGPITVNVTTTFTAKASADGGATWSLPASATVNIGGGGGGGGGGPDISACTALGLNPKVVVANWSGAQIDTSSGVSFGPNDAVIVQFTTGSFTTSTVSGIGSISAVEFGGPTTPRSGALSASACDFTVGVPTYKWSTKSGVASQCGTTVFSGVMGPAAGFSVATLTDLASQKSTICQALLQPNTTYYWNLTNFSPPPPSGTTQCNQSACNMRITLTKPVGG